MSLSLLEQWNNDARCDTNNVAGQWRASRASPSPGSYNVVTFTVATSEFLFQEGK
jgi:hypothetical protein